MGCSLCFSHLRFWRKNRTADRPAEAAARPYNGGVLGDDEKRAGRVAVPNPALTRPRVDPVYTTRGELKNKDEFVDDMSRRFRPGGRVDTFDSLDTPISPPGPYTPTAPNYEQRSNLKEEGGATAEEEYRRRKAEAAKKKAEEEEQERLDFFQML